VSFSTLYALCAFAVVHQNNIMWIDAIIWLPIITSH
ncbi:MAG: YfhO family protein, partial [Paraprevotella sp.]|nr:YfhO family protein [Paraprevotella sp.]